MKKDRKSIINLIQEEIDNIDKKDIFNPPPRTDEPILPPLEELVFRGIYQVAQKMNLSYSQVSEKMWMELITKIPQLPDNQNIKQKLLNQYRSDILRLSNEEIDKIQYYINLNQVFINEFIPHITINKCILDPLGNPISDINQIKIDTCEVNDELLNLLNSNPDYLYQLSYRKFEEVIAEILIRKGYYVELTPATRDGGKDIYVARKDDLGSFLYLVECKKYAPNHHVGLNIIQRLYGVVTDEKATAGIIVTTSYFTKSAKDFQQRHSFQMSLQDFHSIKKWLYEVT